LTLFCLISFVAPSAQAQLAQSFLNVTGIKVNKLPNATQIRIETDGSAQFGTDLRDFVDLDAGWQPKPTQSVRIRIVGARSRLPAFVPLDAYPVDGAVVTLGREDFRDPHFSDRGWWQPEPRVQIELRFAAPIIVRRFVAETYRPIWFGEIIGPREALIEPSPDRRAILITIINDRADATAPARLDRSPRASRKSHLILGKRRNGHFRIDALHSPLRDVLSEVARLSGTKFSNARGCRRCRGVLVLPDATPSQLLAALQNGYGLGVVEENGATVVGRTDSL
jgi:hypothetical protein